MVTAKPRTAEIVESILSTSAEDWNKEGTSCKERKSERDEEQETEGGRL
jgi:hypothetical protein